MMSDVNCNSTTENLDYITLIYTGLRFTLAQDVESFKGRGTGN